MPKPDSLDARKALTLQEGRLFKAGNSLAVRIPSAIAKQIGLREGAPIEIAVADGTIYLRKPENPTLDELVENITSENLHDPTFEELIGAERW